MDYISEILKFKGSQKAAIVSGGVEVSYWQLIDNALRFSAYLGRHNMKSVIIKTARSANAVTAALGVVFSGGVFAFLASSAPRESIENAAADLGADLLIDDDIDFSAFSPVAADFAPQSRAASAPVCAVFTSGSTGRAKGALLTYRSLCETVKWQSGYMHLPAHTHTGSYAEFSFIAAFWEIWYPLASGFTLFIAEREARLDMQKLTQFIDTNHIAYIFLPSDVAEIFTSLYPGGALRFVRVAGGALRACGDPKGYEILYSLGMSENAGSVTFLPIRHAYSGDIPIGKPFGDTEIYLIDGEMAVSGPSLFAGYAGQAQLTEKVRVDNPHANGRADYAKMYLSGDLARRDTDENLVYLGRRDWVIKIGNIKTNPLESERVIRGLPGVAETVVLPFYRGDKSAYLACFYSGDRQPDDFAELLQDRLPPNAIPSYFIRLEAFPRNSNGKIDRTKLKLPALARKAAAFSSTAAHDIAAAFERVLGLDSGAVDAEDSFIRLGGNSLGLMRLQAELIKSLGLELRYSDIFTAQTPRAIAALRPKKDAAIPRTEPKANTPYPLTAPERQMWLLWRTGQDNGRYTVRIQCDFDGDIDRTKAQEAVDKLTQKYPVLCSYYAEKDGCPWRYFSGDKVPLSDSETTRFDLRVSPLFAAALCGRSLVFSAHHILADAAAMRVLAEDFWAFYSGEPTEDALGFHDVELLESARNVETEESYWRQELTGKAFESLPVETTPAGTKELVVRFSREETQSLKAYAATNAVTLFMLFIAAAAQLTTRVCARDEVCIGVPVSGRDLPETIRTVGMLVRTLPMVIDVTQTDFIAAVNEKFGAIAAHQHYPFERMNEQFGARYDVMVNYIPLPQEIKDACGLRPRIVRGGYPAPAVKLVLDLREEEDGISAVFTYDAYQRETIENWADAFRALLLREPVGTVRIPTKVTTNAADNVEPCPDFAAVWAEFFGVAEGNFYELGGTSLIAIQIEEAMLLRGLYISAADILQYQRFADLSKRMIPAEDIDWEAE
jgi:non-ribosomal peptide synthetase component F/acyl carrier protein